MPELAQLDGGALAGDELDGRGADSGSWASSTAAAVARTGERSPVLWPGSDVLANEQGQAIEERDENGDSFEFHSRPTHDSPKVTLNQPFISWASSAALACGRAGVRKADRYLYGGRTIY